MKIAFVYPSNYCFTRNMSWEVRWIYHGLGLLIAAIKKQGIEVNLIDLRRLTGWAEYLEKIKGYDTICFSVMSVDYDIADKGKKLLKKLEELKSLLN